MFQESGKDDEQCRRRNSRPSRAAMDQQSFSEVSVEMRREGILDRSMEGKGGNLGQFNRLTG